MVVVVPLDVVDVAVRLAAVVEVCTPISLIAQTCYMDGHNWR